MSTDAKDSRLDSLIPKFCSTDIDNLCSLEQQITEQSTDALDGSLLKCMLDHIPEIRILECQLEIIRIGGVKSELFNADIAVEGSCQEDILQFCHDDVIAISSPSEIQECLRSHLEQLSAPCKAAEFSELKIETNALELKPTLIRECASGLHMCADVNHCAIANNWEDPDSAECGLNCLRKLIYSQILLQTTGPSSSSSFSSDGDLYINEKCQAEVNAIEQEDSSDYRLYPGMAEHCNQDIDVLCEPEKLEKMEDGSGPAGAVIQCLVQHRNEVMLSPPSYLYIYTQL